MYSFVWTQDILNDSQWDKIGENCCKRLRRNQVKKTSYTKSLKFPIFELIPFLFKIKSLEPMWKYLVTIPCFSALIRMNMQIYANEVTSCCFNKHSRQLYLKLNGGYWQWCDFIFFEWRMKFIPPHWKKFNHKSFLVCFVFHVLFIYWFIAVLIQLKHVVHVNCILLKLYEKTQETTCL